MRQCCARLLPPQRLPPWPAAPLQVGAKGITTVSMTMPLTMPLVMRLVMRPMHYCEA
jgi:hypothetical protein